jgi:rod shape-determining protein MreD
MSAPSRGRLRVALRTATPFLLTVLLLVVGSIPFHLPFMRPIGPGLVLVAVYYWSVHTPWLMSSPVVFAIGLLSDLLGGAPIGVGVLLLLCAHGMALLQRRLVEDAAGIAIWLWFVGTACLTGLLGWLITSHLAGTLMDPWPVGIGTLLAAIVYPFVAWAFHPVQRSLLREA